MYFALRIDITCCWIYDDKNMITSDTFKGNSTPLQIDNFVSDANNHIDQDEIIDIVDYNVDWKNEFRNNLESYFYNTIFFSKFFIFFWSILMKIEE